MDAEKPFIQHRIDQETVVCTGITQEELEVSFLQFKLEPSHIPQNEVFKRLRNAERPKEELKQ